MTRTREQYDIAFHMMRLARYWGKKDYEYCSNVIYPKCQDVDKSMRIIAHSHMFEWMKHNPPAGSSIIVRPSALSIKRWKKNRDKFFKVGA